MEIAQAQVDTRRGTYEGRPLKSLDETLEQEFQKGEVSGIIFMAGFVDVRLQVIEETIKQLLEDIENASGKSDSTSSE